MSFFVYSSRFGSGVAISVFVLQKRRRCVSHTVSHFPSRSRHSAHVHGVVHRTVHVTWAHQIVGDGVGGARHRHLHNNNQQLFERLLHHDHRLLVLLSHLVAASHAAVGEMRSEMG